MKEETGFFVVKKGDLVGVYRNLSDCQTQVGSSICDPPVSVYKGYSMPKDTEEYLLSCGLKHALYSIRAADLTEGLFGTLVPCHFQKDEDLSRQVLTDPLIKEKITNFVLFPYYVNKWYREEVTVRDNKSIANKLIVISKVCDDHLPEMAHQPSSSKSGAPEHMPKKRSQEAMWSEYTDANGSAVTSNDSLRKHIKLDLPKGDQALSSGRSCTLEFDGASKGNPGQAGAGAVVRADDGSLICRLREGLGIATTSVAEYRGFILGLKYAHSKGFTSIRAQGDSKLVCMQIQGLWKVKNQNISTLFQQAKQLKDRFLSFRIIHVLRESNCDADQQANLAVGLPDGHIQEEIEK